MTGPNAPLAIPLDLVELTQWTRKRTIFGSRRPLTFSAGMYDELVLPQYRPGEVIGVEDCKFARYCAVIPVFTRKARKAKRTITSTVRIP